MMLLDTHALVWWVAEPARIPQATRQSLDRSAASGEGVAVSSISVWELSMLVERGRLSLTIPFEAWLAGVEALPFLRFVPVDNRIAARAVALTGFPHRDPADRLITATAIGLGATLVTADTRLRRYRAMKSIWA